MDPVEVREAEATSEEYSTGTLVEKGARSGLFFCYAFLPNTYATDPAEFHPALWEAVDDYSYRYLSIEVFRDGAKTTLARTAALRGICYGLYRNILFLSESGGHSVASLDWIRKQILENERLACFGLEIGETDNKEEMIVYNRAGGWKTYIIAKGITSQIRGLNKEDSRPDLIIGDDIASVENAGSPELLAKLNDLFFGSVVNSLCAKTLNPYSRIMLFGTRLGAGDVIELCEKDDQWRTLRFSILDDNNESTWKSKFPTEQVHRDKQSAIQRNQLSIWMREKECKLITSERSAFIPEQLLRHIVIPAKSIFFLGIDPVPPPSEKQIKEGLKKKDFEVISVLGWNKGSWFLEEQKEMKGHDVEWTLNTTFELATRFRAKDVGVEAVAYQRTIASLLRRAMAVRRNYLRVVEITDPRSKYHKITSELQTHLTDRRFSVNESLHFFISQFEAYPGVQHDDHLDSAVIALMTGMQCLGTALGMDTADDDADFLIEKELGTRELPPFRGCP